MKNYQLPKEFATKWVAELRSGKYEQGRGDYYDKGKDCYCALGVSFKAMGVQPSAWSAEVPDGMRWPVLDSLDIKQEIIALNDDVGKSFSEIADWIEANVEFV